MRQTDSFKSRGTTDKFRIKSQTWMRSWSDEVEKIDPIDRVWMMECALNDGNEGMVAFTRAAAHPETVERMKSYGCFEPLIFRLFARACFLHDAKRLKELVADRTIDSGARLSLKQSVPNMLRLLEPDKIRQWSNENVRSDWLSGIGDSRGTGWRRDICCARRHISRYFRRQHSAVHRKCL